MDQGVIIIGTGHAGVQAAASLREEGYDGPVTLVGDEAEQPYHKPPLSKAFLKEPGAQPQILRAEAFYTGHDIALRFGKRVTAIDPGRKRVHLDGGDELGFDRLILATGSRPRTLDFGGPALSGIYSLRSLADARAIRDHAAQAADVVVLGGGFIGLEIAATLRAGGRTVTVLEAQDRLLGRVVAPAISQHVSDRLERIGVRIMTRTMVANLEGEEGRVTAVVTTAGGRIAADMVLVGIGAVPNSELAAAAGLSTGNGVSVDLRMRTSVPDILAIGDLVNFRHWQTGSDLRLESVQNAHDQARTAARTIVGHEEDFHTVPWFWSDIGDMKLQMAGLTIGSDETVLSGNPLENRFSLFHYRGGNLIAVESVNKPADHMLGRKMIEAGFSPTRDDVAAGVVKDAFARWQQANAG